MARTSHVFLAHRHKLSKRKQKRALDQTVFALSFVQPLSGIPQAIGVWSGGDRISVVTWVCLLAYGFLTLAYGIVHRIKPMIVVNVIWTFIDLAIIVGALTN